MADDKKLIYLIFIIIFIIGWTYFVSSYNIEDFSLGILIVMLIFTIWVIGHSSLSYKKGIEEIKGNILLNSKEKWDFLYQDVWLPFLILFFIVFSVLYFTRLLEGNFELLNVVVLLQWFSIIFRKIILRHKLIITDNNIYYTEYHRNFSEIKFRLVKGMIFDEDERRVTINYEKIIEPKYIFLSTKSKTLDIDEIEETINENKAFSKNGIFDRDWDDLKVILDQKSKEYDFGLSVIYPI